MIFVGALALALASDTPFWLVLTLAVCVTHLRLEMSGRRVRIPDRLASMLCLGAFAVIVLSLGAARPETLLMQLQMLVSRLGHFLLLVQWVGLFREKSNRDYAVIYFITLANVAAASLLVPEIWFAFVILLLVSTAGWALILLHVKQAVESCGGSLRDVGAASIAMAPAARHPARIGRTPAKRPAVSFVLLVLGLTFLVLLPSGLVFAVAPRSELRPTLLPVEGLTQTQPITGFSEVVRLGEIADILENPSRVMSVRATWDTGEPVPLGYPLLIRGITLNYYDGRSWRTTDRDRRRTESRRDYNLSRIYRYEGKDFDGFYRSEKRIICDITLENLDSRVLFAPFALEYINLEHPHSISIDLHHEDVRLTHETLDALRYKTWSRPIEPPEAGDKPRPAPWSIRRTWLQRPEDLSPRIGELARRLTPDREFPTPYQKAKRLEEYLQRNFGSTLDLNPTPGVEPVEDFLFNTKQGHCEYSAMVLMLRSVGIPARIVNGFKGGDWNEFGKYRNIRQMDAHSWVEAYISPVGWITFDPTAAAGSVPYRGAGTWHKVKSFFDYGRFLWTRYVIGYDPEKQGVFYEALRAPFRAARSAMTRLILVVGGERLVRMRLDLEGIVSAVLGPRGRKLLSVLLSRTLIVLYACGAALVLIGFFIKGSMRRMARASSYAGVDFYRRLLKLLATRRGGRFVRASSMTPLEFASRVEASNAPWVDGVWTITRYFCDVHYGGCRLSKPDAKRIQSILARIRSIPVTG